MTKLTRLFGYVWLAVLGLALLVTAADAYARSLEVEEYAKCCDAFGYLQMAKEVRRAASREQYPDYSLETSHTRLLIDFLRAHHVPLSDWNEMVAPHAHHYFPRTGRVGVQYPPGTGLLLALFPQGQAVQGLNQAVIGIFLAVGLVVLVVAGRQQAWAAAGGAIFALQLGLEILGGIGDNSFSINALLAPLLLTFVSLFSALVLGAVANKPWLSWGVAFLGGACFGLALLTRLPILLLLPGVLILLLGTTWRTCVNGSVVAFGAGLGLCGILPLLVHQQQVAGAWYLSTYSAGDNSAPSLEVLATTVPYYFGAGAGNRYQWASVTALVGLAGLVIRTGQTEGRRSPVSWRRLALSVLVLWSIPTVYFLMHRVTVPYYQFPGTFAAVVVFALGGFTVAGWTRRSEEGVAINKGGWWRTLALAAALLPGLVVLERAWPFHLPAFPAPAGTHHSHIPAELTDERAWIFADLLTGTVWYEAERPAHKITFTDTRTRFLVYQFVFDRGEPQYMIRDCKTMQMVLNEIEQMGGTLEPRGYVDDSPYFRVHWPEGGPKCTHLGQAR